MMKHIFMFNTLYACAVLYSTYVTIATLPPKIDLGIILDTSTDMGLKRMQNAGYFITELLERVSISPGTTRISFYSVSKSSSEHFKFNTHVNRECLIKAIKQVQFVFKPKDFDFPSLLADTFNKMHKNTANVDNQKRIYLFITNSIEEFRNFNRKLKFKLTKSDFLGFVLIDFDQDLVGFKDIEYLRYNKRSDLFQILKVLNIPSIEYSKCRNNGKKVFDECNRECTCVNGEIKDCFRVRKEFSAMSTEERQRYLKAYLTLTTQSPYKEIYEKFIFMHYKYFCWGIHKQEYFLPWHRWFISVFEDLLRQIDCRVTLSYWDWTYVSDDPWNLTSIWRSTDDGLGGDGVKEEGYCVQTGMFRESEWETPYWEDPTDVILSVVDRLNMDVKDATAKLSFCLRRSFRGHTPTMISLKRTLDIPARRFRDFDIQMRHNYHDRMHNIIGGTMSTHYAANSPEFFLHHAFLDKIWYVWQKKSPQHKYVHFLQRNKTSMVGCPYTQRDLIDSHELPRCIKVKYTQFPKHTLEKRSDNIDDMSRKSKEHWKQYLLDIYNDKFPNCSRTPAEKKRAKYLHRKLDLGWDI